MEDRKNSKGFTMAEVMLAVGILTILGGLATVGVAQYLRSLTGSAMDTTAKEIYVAAQNHLSMAEGQGFFGLSEGEMGVPDGSSLEGETSYGYYFVSGSTGTARLQNLLLPVASLDESVRAYGSYVIHYQTRPARVLDVFYAEPLGRYPHFFLASEFNDLVSGYRGAANRGKRRNFSGSVIGWYGFSAEQDSIPQGRQLEAPVVELINAERLEVIVTNPNADIANAGLRLIVTGCSSGRQRVIDLIDSGGAASSRYSDDPGGANEKASFHLVIDDVTKLAGHFYNIFCSGETNLIPGENITVRALSYNNHEFTNVASGSGVTTNSLFASLEIDAEKNATAVIANFRHLENLDPAISGIGQSGDKAHYEFTEAPAGSGSFGAAVHLTRAEQAGDMDWIVFQDRIRELRGSPGGVQIFSYDGASTDAGCYHPVRNGGVLAYSGKTASGEAGVIRNVTVRVPGSAGLFSVLENASVSDLELADFEITSMDRCAGALAGSMVNSAVRNVLVRCEEPDGGGVNGSLAAGGLIGELDGTSAQELTGCAAAVPVSADGDAGGLLGRSAGAVTLRGCYAGGRTDINGQTENGFVKNGGYDPENFNVTGGGSAGGLIGSAAGALTASACYATASVSGGGAAGGLIGSAAGGGSVSGCYCTGLVGGAAADRGAFAGSAGEAAFSDCAYLAIVNETQNEAGGVDLDPVGGGETAAGLTAFDDTVSAFQAFAGAGCGAEPYDEALRAQDPAVYPFRTVSELSQAETGANPPEWMSIHYGDWPVPGTQTINVTG